MVIDTVGIVRDGVVVPEPGIKLPEGVRVHISAIVDEPRSESEATLAEAVALFSGKAHGLPSDLSINHDHYLYGTSKK